MRFTPTQPALSSSNVTVSAAGDAVSRLVTGTGIALDTTAPTITITTPTSSPTFSTGNATIALGGTASDTSGVTQVTWTNNRGGSGTASGTTAWTAPGIGLLSGQTVFTVRAHDAAGNTGTDTLTVTLTIAFTFTDDPVVARSTEIKAAHFTQLRTAVNSLRTASGLAPTAWTDPALVPGTTRVRAIHLTELRIALNQVYQTAGRSIPTYTDALGPTIIRAVHMNELRAAIRAF